MNLNKEVTWIVTRNTVKDRMIDSSLIHRFSDSKKFKKSTRLLNKLLEKYRHLHGYQDYVKMKKLSKQKVCMDKEIEDEESFGEDDYSILHEMNISFKNDIKRPKDAILNKKDFLTPTTPNEITPIDVNLLRENRKRLKTSRVNDKNDDEVPVKKKRLKDSPKQCLKNKEEIQPIINKNNNSDSFDINNMDVLLQTNINYTTAVLDTKDTNQLVDDTKDKEQIDNHIHKIEIMEDTMREPSMQVNHLQLLDKYPMEEKIYHNIIDVEENEVVDHFEISNVNPVQEMPSHNTNDIIQNTESSFHDVKHNVIHKKQDEVICDINVMHNSTNSGNITKENSKVDVCSPNSIVLQLPKSPPVVKSTEIINKKYKIINKINSYCESSTECYDSIQFLESSTPLSYSKCEKKEILLENESYEDSISSSVLSQSEKRTRQLKMLNLSLESTSSSSEDEIPQVKNNFSETTVLNNSLSKAFEKNTTWSKLKLNRSKDTCKKDKSFHSLQNINNNTNHQHNPCNKDLSKRKKISSESFRPKVQTLGERHRNLEEFVKHEKLVQDTTASAFTLMDFSDDEEIFLIDMPITVKLADLQGQRIRLKNELLKLGTNKYEILYKDIPSQSCVFSTCKDSEPYKMINIKPKGSIIVKRKFFPLSVP